MQLRTHEYVVWKTRKTPNVTPFRRRMRSSICTATLPANGVGGREESLWNGYSLSQNAPPDLDPNKNDIIRIIEISSMSRDMFFRE